MRPLVSTRVPLPEASMATTAAALQSHVFTASGLSRPLKHASTALSRQTLPGFIREVVTSAPSRYQQCSPVSASRLNRRGAGYVSATADVSAETLESTYRGRWQSLSIF